LYEDCNFQGPSTAITRLGSIDLWEFYALGIRNDAVSSIKVAPGYEIEFFEDGGYSGRRLTLRNDVACLSKLEQSMDDLLSSMIIRQAGEIPKHLSTNVLLGYDLAVLKHCCMCEC
jgi:hypothetical protein